MIINNNTTFIQPIELDFTLKNMYASLTTSGYGDIYCHGL